MPAIGVHHTEVKDGAWDGPGAKANLKDDGTEAYYRKAFAWEDSQTDKTTKSAYKFIHHFVASDGSIGAASKVACSSGIAVLNGGRRGGADIPSADRSGVWSHLAAHLRDFGIADADIPKLRSHAEPTIERRSFMTLELRAIDAGEGKMPKIAGHAAVFNSLSQPMGGFMRFVEKISPGAFKDSIGQDDIRALINHDPMWVLGRNKAGTLALREDGKGLAVEIDPPDTSYARDLVESIKRGDISQMSFGFDTIDDSWDFKRGSDDPAVRTLNKVKLYDVSPVTYPAYTQTDINCRSLDSILADGMRRAGIEIEEPHPERSIALLRRRLELEL